MKKQFAALAAAALLTAAGCSQDSNAHSGMGMGMGMGNTSETTAAAADLPKGVAQADVTFAQSMIPHHRQAVEMADHVLADGVDPEVKTIATRIKEAQGPEIETMSRWLEGWKRDVPAEGDHTSMDGMMSDDDMASFMETSGADLDSMFLTMMIEHHEGAIAMANTEITDGEDPDAVALAESISSSQEAEIDEMRTLLGNLTSA